MKEIYNIPTEISKHNVQLVETDEGNHFFDPVENQPICSTAHSWKTINDVLNANKKTERFTCTECQLQIGVKNPFAGLFRNKKKEFSEIIKRMMIDFIQYIVFYELEYKRGYIQNSGVTEALAYNGDPFQLASTPTLVKFGKSISDTLMENSVKIQNIILASKSQIEYDEKKYAGGLYSQIIESFAYLRALIFWMYTYSIEIEFMTKNYVMFPFCYSRSRGTQIPTKFIQTLNGLGKSLVSSVKTFIIKLQKSNELTDIMIDSLKTDTPIITIEEAKYATLKTGAWTIEYYETTLLYKEDILIGVHFLTEKIIDTIWNHLFK